VRDGQTGPHRPRLVVSRSTCPPISPHHHANSFVIGPAVINTHTGRLVHTGLGASSLVALVLCPPPSPPHTREQLCNSTAVINTHPSAVPRCGFEVRRFVIAVAWYKYIHTHSSIRKKRQEVEVRPEFRGIRGLREQRRASADTFSITRIRRSSSWIIVPRKHTGTKRLHVCSSNKI